MRLLESEYAKAVMRFKLRGYLTKETTNVQILEELQNPWYPVVKPNHRIDKGGAAI